MSEALNAMARLGGQYAAGPDVDDDNPSCTLVWPGDICYCTGRPGCMEIPVEDDADYDGSEDA